MISTKITVPDTLCYDFLCSIMRLYNNPELTPKSSPNPEVLEWVSKYSAIVPPGIRETASSFFNMETSFGLTLVGLIGQSQAETVPDFISYLEALPPQQILACFLYSGVGPGTDITTDLVAAMQDDQRKAYRFVQEQLSFSPQEKWRVLEYLLQPAETIKRFAELLRWHYDNIYCHDEDKVAAFLAEANRELRERLRYDEEYLRLMIPYDKGRPPRALTIALSYYYESASLYDVMEATYVFGFRYHDDIESRHSVFSGVQVFKALADETRLQMLKLLLQRPWYGHELAQRLEISNSTVSHHISILALCGMVKTYKKENRVYYELDAGEVRQIAVEALERILLD